MKKRKTTESLINCDQCIIYTHTDTMICIRIYTSTIYNDIILMYQCNFPMCYIVVLWNHVQTLSICKGLGSEARHLRSHSGRAFQDEDLRAVVHQENWSKRSCAIFDIIFINFRRCSMYSCTFPLEYFIYFHILYSNCNICLHLSEVNSSTSLPSCGFRIGIGDLGERGGQRRRTENSWTTKCHLGQILQKSGGRSLFFGWVSCW